VAKQTRQVRLRLFGEEHAIDVPARRGPMRVTDLFEPARVVCEYVAGVARRQATAGGAQISCKAGCGACCKQLVPISTVEAKRLAALVTSMPPARRDELRARFVAAVARLEQAGLLDPAARGRANLVRDESDDETDWENVSRRYWEAELDCPFLEAGSCSIYEDRPLVCREFSVTSDPRFCAERTPDITPVPRPVRMGDALAAAAHTACGVQAKQLPLTLALEWAAYHGTPLGRTPDAAGLLDALVAAIVVEDDA
jgi:Fe-S-cluster containining protein